MEYVYATTELQPLRFNIEMFTQCIVTWDSHTDTLFNVGRAMGLYLYVHTRTHSDSVPLCANFYCLRFSITNFHPHILAQDSAVANERRLLPDRACAVEIGHDTRPPGVSQHGAHMWLYVRILYYIHSICTQL